jgi:hypothetical protein
MSHQSVSPDVRVVREKLDTLRQLPRDQIANLPSAAETEVSLEGKRHQLVVWHEIRSSGEEWVIVQLYRSIGLGIVRRLHGEGFTVSAEGDQRLLSAAEVDEFTR